MSKKIILNGMEILISVDNVCAKSFFDFTEGVIHQLENRLDNSEENFHIRITTEFSLTGSPKNNISVNGLTNQRTKEKVMAILQENVGLLSGHTSGTARVNLIVEDW